MLTSYTLGYHDVSDTGDASEHLIRQSPQHYTLSRQAFRDHLQCIRVAAGLQAVQTIEQTPRPARCPVYLTFDDGAVGAHACIADELERFDWRGHFFVTSDWIGTPGFMGPAEIRDLRRRGHVIGSHTRSHPNRMSKLSWPSLIAEWLDSCAALSDILGEPIISASVSDGYYSRRVGRSASFAGLQFLFNSEPVSSSEQVEDCLVLGRYSIRADSPASLSGLIAAGARSPRWRQWADWQWKKPLKSLGGTRYLAFRRAVLEARAKQPFVAGS